MANDSKTLLATDPCFQCLSLEQLDQLRLALWAKAASKPLPTNLASILEDSACLNCMSDKQRAQAEVTKLKEAFGAGVTFAELIEETKCLKCVDPRRVRAALLLMEAEYLDTL